MQIRPENAFSKKAIVIDIFGLAEINQKVVYHAVIFNPSNAEDTFIQSTRTQGVLKTI